MSLKLRFKALCLVNFIKLNMFIEWLTWSLLFSMSNVYDFMKVKMNFPAYVALKSASQHFFLCVVIFFAVFVAKLCCYSVESIVDIEWAFLSTTNEISLFPWTTIYVHLLFTSKESVLRSPVDIACDAVN